MVASKAVNAPPAAMPLASNVAALGSVLPDHGWNTRLPAVENAPLLQVPYVLGFEPNCQRNVLLVMLIAESCTVKTRGSAWLPPTAFVAELSVAGYVPAFPLALLVLRTHWYIACVCGL